MYSIFLSESYHISNINIYDDAYRLIRVLKKKGNTWVQYISAWKMLIMVMKNPNLY